MIFYVLIHLYWIGAAIAACTYLSLWLNDRETPFSDTTSWIVLVIATLLWPLVLPISLKTELLPRLHHQHPPSLEHHQHPLQATHQSAGQQQRSWN